MKDCDAIGFISYSSFHLKDSFAELDIWLKDEASCGHGYGTEAIILLSGYLKEKLEITELLIAPAEKNKRAIRAYKKAGFQRTDKAMTTFLSDSYKSLYGNGDYGISDTAILVKTLEY